MVPPTISSSAKSPGAEVIEQPADRGHGLGGLAPAGGRSDLIVMIADPLAAFDPRRIRRHRLAAPPYAPRARMWFPVEFLLGEVRERSAEGETIR